MVWAENSNPQKLKNSCAKNDVCEGGGGGITFISQLLHNHDLSGFFHWHRWVIENNPL